MQTVDGGFVDLLGKAVDEGKKFPVEPKYLNNQCVQLLIARKRVIDLLFDISEKLPQLKKDETSILFINLCMERASECDSEMTQIISDFEAQPQNAHTKNEFEKIKESIRVWEPLSHSMFGFVKIIISQSKKN